jgi:hypothetical protein
MPTFVCTNLHTIQVHSEVVQSYVAHLNFKAGFPGRTGLLKGNFRSEGSLSSKRSVRGEACSGFDMTVDKCLEVAIDLLTNLSSDP